MTKTWTKVAVTAGAVVSAMALAVAPASAKTHPGHTNQGNHGTPSAACVAARATVNADRAAKHADLKQLRADKKAKDKAAVAADRTKLKMDEKTLAKDIHARNKACSNGKHKG